MISIRLLRHHSVSLLTWSLIAAGFIYLAIEPTSWLVETWVDPVFDSAGGHFLVVAVGLAIWSASSPSTPEAPTHESPWWCLPTAAALRFAGHVLVIPVLEAMVLPLGVYTLGRLAGLGHRRRAVSPFWLAVLVGLALPVEHIAKRLIGYPLQHIAADGACSLLQLGYSGVSCTGLDIALRGRELLVALPCSGVRGLLLYTTFFAALAALIRPSLRQAAVGFGVATTAAVVVNSSRIALLAAGLAHQTSLGIDVMQQPWHMAVGFACLPIGLAQVAIWALWEAQTPAAQNEPSAPTESPGRPVLRLTTAMSFLAVTVAIPFVPKHPVDVAGSNAELELPDRLSNFPRQSSPLRRVAHKHFAERGGKALEANYGPHTLLVVETSTPLRHLHTPDEWLGDVGYSVETTGRTDGALPTTNYRVQSRNGRRWQLDVTFVSDRGRLATTPSEAIWYWLSSPTTSWRALYRFHPHGTRPAHINEFDRSLAKHYRLVDWGKF